MATILTSHTRYSPAGIIRNCHFTNVASDIYYKRDFLEIFPRAAIKTARIGDIGKRRSALSEISIESSITRQLKDSKIDVYEVLEGAEVEVDRMVCSEISQKLIARVEELKEREQVITYEEDSHEFALPFFLSLKEVFGEDLKVLCLDDHLDAEANMFSYNSFWKFAINNSLISPENLMIYGSAQTAAANDFLKFFEFESRGSFISALMSLMPPFDRRVIFLGRGEAWRGVNEYLESNLTPFAKEGSLDKVRSAFLAFSDNTFGPYLRSFWEAQGLKRKGVSLISPPGLGRKNKGNTREFEKALKRIKDFASGSNLMVNPDIDVRLHPDRLFAIAETIVGARPKRIAFSLAGLNSRDRYPVGIENEEIKRFYEILCG